MNKRDAIRAALDALETGDQAHAADVLLEALDEDRWGTRVPPVCRVCGARAWPGDVARHVYSRHHPVEARRAA